MTNEAAMYAGAKTGFQYMVLGKLDRYMPEQTKVKLEHFVFTSHSSRRQKILEDLHSDRKCPSQPLSSEFPHSGVLPRNPDS